MEPTTCNIAAHFGFFSPGPRVTKCPWTTFSCKFELDRNRQPNVGSTSHQLHWSPSIPLPLRGLSTMFAWPSDFIVHRFHKIGFSQFPSMQLSHWWVNSAKPSIVSVLVVFPYHNFTYTLVRSNNMQYCCSIWFLVLRLRVTKCPWMTFSCNFHIDITW